VSFVLERVTSKPPMTANAGMRGGMSKGMHRHVADWRKWARDEAKDHGWAPITRPVAVTIVHLRKTAASMPDVGAVLFIAKAMVDGLVDAKILAGDGPSHVQSLHFTAPEVCGRHGVRLTVHELELQTPALHLEGLLS
jgi:hypothetical protein